MSRENTLKKYLWIHIGGQGAHREFLPREFFHIIAELRVELFIIFSDPENSIFANNKWFRVHHGASGSSIINASDFVFVGMFVNLISGNLPSHWHV